MDITKKSVSSDFQIAMLEYYKYFMSGSFYFTYFDFYINNHLFLAWLVVEKSTPQVVSFTFFTSLSPHNLAWVVHGIYDFPTIHYSKRNEITITISKNFSFIIFQMKFHS